MIDEKQIREWAEDPKAAISRDWQEWSAERHELAQMVLHLQGPCDRLEVLSSARKAMRERDGALGAIAQAKYYQDLAEGERDKARTQRDALAAALAKLVWDFRTVEDAQVVLDDYAPGWREK